MPRLQLKNRAQTTSAKKPHLHKSQIKLEDYGVTFSKYKQELERGITLGYGPHFGYPMIKFNDIM